MTYTDPWCTRADRWSIKRATSFPSLVKIAKRVIDRNRKPNQPVIQVCGPMANGGGTLKENTDKIEQMIVLMRADGLCVFSQVTFQEGMLNFMTVEDYHRNPLQLLDGFYGELFRGGYIQKLVFLPKWEGSFGCRWERSTGKKLGMEIEFLPDTSTRPRVLFSLPISLL